jgi:hypothetical protein
MSPGDWYPTDPDTCQALADVIVVAHFAIVAFVIVGELLVVLGGLRSWSWVRNRWFRGLHFALIGFIAIQALAGELCPLTTWENELRWRAGRPIEQSSFVARWLHELLFVEVDVSTLAWCYVGFALLVLGTLFLVPVRWRGRPEREAVR